MGRPRRWKVITSRRDEAVFEGWFGPIWRSANGEAEPQA
jgi:hypothetical protein